MVDIIFVSLGCLFASLPFVDGECVGSCCRRLGGMIFVVCDWMLTGG